jgi:hypothetical protein
VMQFDHGAAEPNTREILISIEPGIIKTRCNDVLHRTARRYPGNELTHQQSGNRRIAVSLARELVRL